LSPQGSSAVAGNGVTTRCALPPAVTSAQDGGTSPVSSNLFSTMRDTRRKNAANGTSAEKIDDFDVDAHGTPSANAGNRRRGL